MIPDPKNINYNMFIIFWRQSTEAAAIWRQQKDLAFILAVMLELGDDGVGSGSITLFDQSFAW